MSLSVAGTECNPRGADSCRGCLIFGPGSVVWGTFNALRADGGGLLEVLLQGLGRRDPSVARAPRDDRRGLRIARRGGLWAQKKIHGAAASAAECCDFCEKNLLPVCRSWRERRPVYGPSLGICVVLKSACQGGAQRNSTFERFWPIARCGPGYLPAIAGLC